MSRRFLAAQGVVAAVVVLLSPSGSSAHDFRSEVLVVGERSATGELVITATNGVPSELPSPCRRAGEVATCSLSLSALLDWNAATADPAVIVVEAPDGTRALASATRSVSPDAAFLWIGRGFEHIVAGADHLLVLLGLMLLVFAGGAAQTPRRRGVQLTLAALGFSLGHGASTVWVVFGGLSPSGAVVELLIGASIVALGLELLAKAKDTSSPRQLALVCVGVGLVHGLGFAGALDELVGLSAETVVPPLIGFNVGVELGQLAVLILGVAVIAVVRRLFDQRLVSQLATFAAYLLGAVGCALCFDRAAAWWEVLG